MNMLNLLNRMYMKKIIATKNAPAAIGPYNQAIQVGNFLFASGQLGLVPETGAFAEGGVKEQTAQAFQNVANFSGDFPARSAVAVKTLPKNALVEVEVIAYK